MTDPSPIALMIRLADVRIGFAAEVTVNVDPVGEPLSIQEFTNFYCRPAIKRIYTLIERQLEARRGEAA